ncbi:MAG: DUF1073 domain-containing protein [Candidatus Diapherotrites archaeon]|nr:DUF1073 domain-containing protein [Candidatus Diapherotrites archaeon]
MNSIIDKVSNVTSKTLDGLTSFIARIGLGADNLLSTGGYHTRQLTANPTKLEAMYRGGWLIGATVDSIAEDMTKKGVEFTGEIEPKQKEQLGKALQQKGVWSALTEDISWGRLYGGSIAVIVINGQDSSKPLDIKTVGKGDFMGLRVYDRHQVSPSTTLVTAGGMDDGLPESYKINGTGVDWHYTRVVRQVGVKLPENDRKTEQYWGASIIERIDTAVYSFDTATASAGSLLSKAYLRTIGVKGLWKILAGGGKAQQLLEERFHLMGKIQGTEGVTLIDSDDTFKTHSYSFAGLSDIMLQFGQIVSGASQTPLVRLFGQSPSGLNSSGESDLRTYYDGIEKRQETDLREPLGRIVRVQYRSLYGQAPPEDFGFNFIPLWQLSETEKAEIANKTTTSVQVAHMEGLIDTATAMKELKQSSAVTGLFDTITEDQIKEAEGEEPPPPDTEEGGAE